MTRLAIVSSHPIQYYAPWFRHIVEHSRLDVRAFYLWDFGVAERHDPGFGHSLRWDIDLLDGYSHEFVSNWSHRPGTNHALGLVNPGLGRALRRFRPDAVLSFGYAQASPLWLGLTTDYPLILRGDSHALVDRPDGSGLKSLVRRRILRRAQAHLAVGVANREWLLMHGVPADRIHMAPHAIDQNRFRSAAPDQGDTSALLGRRAELGIPPDSRVVGFVGKLEDKKRPLLLIDAFRDADVPDSVLLLVGSGPLASAVESAIASDHRILHVPFVNQSAMPSVHALIDVLVLPSAGAHETWGLVVNEAQCLGKAVIVSSHVGCHPDLVIPGKTGWVFPSGDRGALSQSIVDALRDPDRLRAFGDNARVLSERFTYAEATAGLLRAIDRVIHR